MFMMCNVAVAIIRAERLTERVLAVYVLMKIRHGHTGKASLNGEGVSILGSVT
jgi:hypothetical protein